MDEIKKLRRGDFLASIVLALFGLFIIAEALQMPMKAKWGGVAAYWYVSPALMPLIVGTVITLLSVLVLLRAIKDGGARAFVEMAVSWTKGMSDAGFRFLAILIALFTFVFLDVPRVDFFLSILFFLLYFMTVFYLDDIAILKKLSVYYVVVNLVTLAIFATSIGTIVNGLFTYTTDVLTLLFTIGFWVYARVLVKGNGRLKKKLRLTLVISVLVPLVLCPAFDYGLLMPLPHEGGIIALMDLIRYAVGGK